MENLNIKGKYSFGDEITLADAFLFPQAQGAVDRFKVDLKEYPRLQEIMANLRNTKEFEDALPKNQPDFNS